MSLRGSRSWRRLGRSRDWTGSPARIWILGILDRLVAVPYRFSRAPIEKQTKKQRNRTIRIPPVLRGHRTETVAPAAAAATEDGRRASPTWNHPSSSSAAAGQASKQRPLHRPGRRLDAGSPRDPLAGPAANCDPRKRCVGK